MKLYQNVYITYNIMESINAVRLKRGLSTIKNSLTNNIGAVWKLKKVNVINKIKSLGYKYNDEKKELTTNSMIRKKARVKL